MRKSRFTEEFKAEAIKQVTERGHKVVDERGSVLTLQQFQKSPCSILRKTFYNQKMQ